MKSLSKTGLGILTLQTFVLCEKNDLKAETGTKLYTQLQMPYTLIFPFRPAFEVLAVQ